MHYDTCFRDGGQDIYSKEDGGHWHNLLIRSQPCKVNYDYIVRTETNQLDAPFIVNHKLRGRGLNLKTKSRREQVAGEYSNFGRRISEYSSIPDDLFYKIIDRYKNDFLVYGYNFTRLADGSVLTECNCDENGGKTCC